VSWSVLVVDDEPMTRNMLRMILSYAGHEIYEAEDGLDALQKIEQYSPDLVILDVMMPNMDGIDVCKALRKNEKTSNLPVVMLSARTNPADVEAGLAAGANKYLTKPISRKQLLEEVQELLMKTAALESNR
jgi:DNA-binding response OmpR family regulator